MAEYAIYAKRTMPVYDIKSGKTIPPDKTFMPINYAGIRVRKQDLTDTFATKDDAQNFIDSHKFREGVITEIRKL